MALRDFCVDLGSPRGGIIGRGKPLPGDSGERFRSRKAWERGLKARSYRLQGRFEARRLWRRGNRQVSFGEKSAGKQIQDLDVLAQGPPDYCTTLSNLLHLVTTI